MLPLPVSHCQRHPPQLPPPLVHARQASQVIHSASQTAAGQALEPCFMLPVEAQPPTASPSGAGTGGRHRGGVGSGMGRERPSMRASAARQAEGAKGHTRGEGACNRDGPSAV